MPPQTPERREGEDQARMLSNAMGGSNQSLGSSGIEKTPLLILGYESSTEEGKLKDAIFIQTSVCQ